MAKNYYVVKVGRSPGIYTSWEECKQQVSQYPNAVFKGFNNYSEAQNWLNENDTAKVSLLKGMVAYVDGSYRADTKEYSCGMVVLKNDEVIYRFSKKYQDAAASMRNVAGEISGAKAAMAYAIANNETSLTIYHDYEGIRAWCTGEWKAKNSGYFLYKFTNQKGVLLPGRLSLYDILLCFFRFCFFRLPSCCCVCTL